MIIWDIQTNFKSKIHVHDSLIGCYVFCGDILVSLNISSTPCFLISSSPFNMDMSEKILPLVSHLNAPTHQKMTYIKKRNAIILFEIFKDFDQLQNKAKASEINNNRNKTLPLLPSQVKLSYYEIKGFGLKLVYLQEMLFEGGVEKIEYFEGNGGEVVVVVGKSCLSYLKLGERRVVLVNRVRFRDEIVDCVVNRKWNLAFAASKRGKVYVINQEVNYK